MSDSTKWALEQLEAANHIFEPDEKTWLQQLINLVIWAVEVMLIWKLAYTLFGL
jgi:hypothetical protein